MWLGTRSSLIAAKECPKKTNKCSEGMPVARGIPFQGNGCSEGMPVAKECPGIPSQGAFLRNERFPPPISWIHQPSVAVLTLHTPQQTPVRCHWLDAETT